VHLAVCSVLGCAGGGGGMSLWGFLCCIRMRSAGGGSRPQRRAGVAGGARMRQSRPCRTFFCARRAAVGMASGASFPWRA